MADLSARKYDAHYRRLGLMPGATPDEVGQAARALKQKLQPERLNAGPLKDIAPIRLAEIDESTMHLTSYWQRYGAAPPSIQKRSGEVFPALSDSQLPHLHESVSLESKGSSVLVADCQDSATQLFVAGDETEIRKTDQMDLIGPLEPELNFSFFLFKKADGAVSPDADVIKSRSIIGLIILGLLWVAIPLFLVKVLAFIFQDCGVDRWLDYASILAHVIPVCFVPPLVIYEYAFFRQLQFPFAGAIRLPVEQAIEDCVSRLTIRSIGNQAGWTVEKKSLECNENAVKNGEIVAKYTGVDGDAKLPLKIHIRVEELSSTSSFLVYWFNLDWQLLFKGRAVSRMKSARFELERLIKES